MSARGLQPRQAAAYLSHSGSRRFTYGDDDGRHERHRHHGVR